MVDESQREIDKPFLDIGAIFDRISQEKGFKADQALAQFLGKSPQAISQARKTGRADLWSILEVCAGLDLNWLLLGREAKQEGVEAALRTLTAAGFEVTLKAPPAAPAAPRPQGEGSNPL